MTVAINMVLSATSFTPRRWEAAYVLHWPITAMAIQIRVPLSLGSDFWPFVIERATQEWGSQFTTLATILVIGRIRVDSELRIRFTDIL